LKHFKLVLLTFFLHLSLNAQSLSMEGIGQNIQSSLPKLLKGKNKDIVANIYQKTAYAPLWAGKANEHKTSQLIQALKDPLFSYKNKHVDQHAVITPFYNLDIN